jgi:hypothetical protein
MILRRGAFLALLAGTWSAAALAEVPPPDSPGARHEAQRLAELPTVVPTVAGPTRQGASNKDASRITAAGLPIGRWPTGGR